jgi:hypothetical protein
MVAGAVEKHLGFVLEPPESARVNDPVSVPLILGTPIRWFFPVLAAPGFTAELGVRGEVMAFELFEFLASARHED